MKRFVMGDVHGRYEALKQVLDRSNFNYEEDLLICLGDICDGNSKVKECFDELLKIKNLIYILGNHDHWTLEWFTWNEVPWVWKSQGGEETMRSYDYNHDNIPAKHISLLRYEAKNHYLTEDNILFVHGGINPEEKLEDQNSHTMMWDRELIHHAKKEPIKGYKHIYVGHTPVQTLEGKHSKPVTFNNLTMMDTGCGYIGRLTIMDIDTREFWQSDNFEGLT